MFKLLKKILSPIPMSAPVSDSVLASAVMQSTDARKLKERGNEFIATGQFEQAAACYRKAIAIAPGQTDAYTNLAFSLIQLKQPFDAFTVLKSVVAIDPANADALYMQATITRDSGKLNEAISAFETLIAMEPQFERAYIDLYDILDKCGRGDEAPPLIATAISLFPTDARFHYIQGTLHAKAAGHSDAIQCFEKAISLQPDYANLYFHLAVSLYAQGRLEETVRQLRTAIALKPDYLEAYGNLGTALMDLNYLDDALDSYRHAIRLNADHAASHFNEGLCKLRLGDFEHGFKKYEWRWKDKRFEKARREFVQPLWLGQESLKNKIILLHAEQGLGDTIQFCRYVKLVADRGATVLLQVPVALHALLSDLEGVTEILDTKQPLPQFDFHCPLLSLPLAFGTNVATIPTAIPYLRAPVAIISAVRDAIGSENAFRIGLCWKGNTSYPRDADRSPGITPFEKLISEFRGTKAKFYTLLPESREGFVRSHGEDLGHEVDQNTSPFIETTGLIMNFDLIITCDTSIGHITGALGKPAWIVLPFSPDWRWIRDREDSPWYPSTRLFHQTERGNWEELFERVAARLKDVLNGSCEPIWQLNQPHQQTRSQTGLAKP